MLDKVVTWLASKLTLVDTTMWGIQVVSTVFERILLFVVCTAAIAATLFLTPRVRSPKLRPFVPLIASLVLFRGLYAFFPGPRDGDIALFLVLVMAVLLLPVWMPRGDAARGVLRLGAFRWFVSVIVLPLLAVGLMNGWSLVPFAQRLHADPAVHKFTKFDLDSLALDAENQLLYASGHGSVNVLAYDLKDLNRGPYWSQVSTERAQSFYYNSPYGEIYVLDQGNHKLFILNAKTLDAKRSVPDLHMTEGDSRIVYDSQTDTILVASEGTYWGSPSDEKGYPIAVIKRSTGQILYTMRDCGGLCIPGLITMHPRLPLVYLAFPKKVLALNTVTRQIAGTPFVSNQWVDGLAVTPDGNELLVGVPLRSTVLRFDAESLNPKGAIDTVFGVRTLAVDSERDLLLTASLATNMVDVIDLRTSKRVAKYYLGPWLRSICLDTKNDEAYVSSAQGLFKVDYTARLPQRYK